MLLQTITRHAPKRMTGIDMNYTESGKRISVTFLPVNNNFAFFYFSFITQSFQCRTMPVD